MLKVTCLKVANEISSLQFKLAQSAWCEISLVISIHVIFLHLAYVDNQPEIDCIYLPMFVRTHPREQNRLLTVKAAFT